MSVTLTGLDGSNPLAFLAAVGILCAGESDWRLRWELQGTWVPHLEGPGSMSELLERLFEEAQTWKEAPAFQLKYSGKQDLKPDPQVFREWWRGLEDTEHGRGMASAFGLAEVTDNNGAVKPNALHFTAGQQQFLKMVGELLEGLSCEDLQEAVVGPWHATRTLPSFSWDATVRREYALRATDPSKDKRTGVPGADWLALRAWPLLKVFAVKGRLQSTGCRGGWKSGSFRWPLWGAWATRSTVEMLMTQLPSRAGAASRGVETVFESRILRTDQGGYGSFTPARAVF